MKNKENDVEKPNEEIQKPEKPKPPTDRHIRNDRSEHIKKNKKRDN